MRVLQQNRAVVAERQRRHVTVAVGVEALVVNDPQVVALAEVVAKTHVGRDRVGSAVVLEEVHPPIGGCYE